MIRTDLYQQVTDTIIAQIEANPGDWLKPWRQAAVAGMPVNATTARPYRGVNVLTLWSAATGAGYSQNAWASYKQWAAVGAQVRKGERGTMIVYQGKAKAKAENDNEGEAAKTFRFLKFSYVFNVAQVDNAPAIAAAPSVSLAQRLAAAEEFVTASGADISHGGDRACYSIALDGIRMPPRDSFAGSPTTTATEAYYGTLLHELTHWTGHASRCNRQFGKRFGDAAYAVEELVAELGAAFLCAQLGISAETRVDHAQYLAHWLKVLKADKRAIFTAAAKASDAAGFLTRLQPVPVEAPAPVHAPAGGDLVLARAA